MKTPQVIVTLAILLSTQAAASIIISSPQPGKAFLISRNTAQENPAPCGQGEINRASHGVYTVIPLQKRTPLQKDQELVVMAGGRANLLEGQRHATIIGPARVIRNRSSVRLIRGTVIRYPATPTPGLPHTLRSTPDTPAQGGFTVFQLTIQNSGGTPLLRLQGKRNSFFYPEQHSKDRTSYIARVGIDCRDTRRDQPYTIRFTTRGGIRVTIKGSLLLYQSRNKQPDPLKEFSWDDIPKRLSPGRVSGSGHPKLTREVSDLFKKKQPPRIKTDKSQPKKNGPPITRFRPTINLSGSKRRLYNKREAIREEGRIHWKALAASRKKQLWEGKFIYPGHHWFSSIFGEVRFWSRASAYAHRGIDIAAPHGTPVIAPNSGRVRFAGHTVLCGNNIILDHGQFVFSKIFHLSSLSVRSGEYVKKGQMIGRTGSTGISTGPHIHWEMWVGSTKVDPNRFILGGEASLKPPLPAGTRWKRLYRFLTPPR